MSLWTTILDHTVPRKVQNPEGIQAESLAKNTVAKLKRRVRPKSRPAFGETLTQGASRPNRP